MIFKYLPNDIKNKIFNYNINKNSDIFLNSVIKYKKRQEEINNIIENENIRNIIFNDLYKSYLLVFFYKNKKYIYKLLYKKQNLYINKYNKDKILNYIIYMKNFNFLCGILLDNEFKIIVLLFKKFLLNINI